MSLMQCARSAAIQISKSASQLQARSFFNLPSPFSSSRGSPSSSSPALGKLSKRGSLSVYEESRELPYSPKELYSVIADVDAYQDFLPFTTSSRVLSAVKRDPSEPSEQQPAPTVEKGWLKGGRAGEAWELRGELQIGAMGFQEGYVSTVQAQKWQKVSASANNTSIFKDLETSWSLVPLSEGASPRTRVDLYLAWQFISPFHAAAVSTMWDKVSGMMITGFEKRVQQVHGRR